MHRLCLWELVYFFLSALSMMKFVDPLWSLSQTKNNCVRQMWLGIFGPHPMTGSRIGGSPHSPSKKSPPQALMKNRLFSEVPMGKLVSITELRAFQLLPIVDSFASWHLLQPTTKSSLFSSLTCLLLAQSSSISPFLGTLTEPGTNSSSWTSSHP